MTTNQTIDGVPRELLEDVFDELPDWNTPAGTKLSAMLDAPESTPCAKSQVEPDPTLCKFYDVTDWSGLVRELVGHVAQLQDSAKRNVKPWEDTFPPTLLPTYIERVNAENAAAQPQGDTVPVSAHWSDWSMVTLEIEGKHRTYVETGKPEQPAAVVIASHS